jgi:hypothetical protein
MPEKTAFFYLYLTFCSYPGEISGLGAWSRGPSSYGAINRSSRRREGKAGNTQEQEEFTGPEEDVKETPSLQIAQIIAVQANVEGLARALLNEGTHGCRIESLRAETPAPGIQTLELVIATQQEMIQAKILLAQRSNWGARTRIHATVAFSLFCIHSTQAH